jgi:hypothetical protein
MDAVGRDRHLVLRLDHRHGRAALQNLGQDAGMAGVEVLHQHEAHAAVGRHRPEELFEGLQPAGGGAKPDDGKTRGLRSRGHCSRNGLAGTCHCLPVLVARRACRLCHAHLPFLWTSGRFPLRSLRCTTGQGHYPAITSCKTAS